MKRNKIYRSLILSGCTLLLGGLTSCDDFLTIHPSNQIVEEEFWEDKGDLESAVAACYQKMTRAEMTTRYVIWGECRSDNFVMNNEGFLTNLMKANLSENDEYTDWSSFYTTINYCNKVLEHGDQIVAKDPSFGHSDWLPVKAEALTLRALNYFYLIRTFRDVPFVDQSINTDAEAVQQKIPASSQEFILGRLISDLEGIKDSAMINYGNIVYNKGRITKKAIYTVLADLYLWRAAKNAPDDSVAIYKTQSADDYRKCIENCDFVINEMIRESQENYGSSMGGSGSTLWPGKKYPLITFYKGISANSTGMTDIPYQEIFSIGNSDESIFELQFDGSSNKNGALTDFSILGQDHAALYSKVDNNKFSAGILLASQLYKEVTDDQDPKATTGKVYSKTDIRRWQGIAYLADQKELPIMKYLASDITLKKMGDMTLGAQQMGYSGSSANWIFYRLSEVLLMKAEALSKLYPNDEVKLKEAFELVNAVYERSNPVLEESKKLKFENYNTSELMFDFVMRERQREFFAEGKRWFDLVRITMCDNNKGSAHFRKMLDLLLRKYVSGQTAVEAKMKSSMDALYSPIYKEELKANPSLKQNPSWKTSEVI